MQRRYLKMGVSAVFSVVFFLCFSRAFMSSVILLSAFFSRAPTFVLQNKQWKALLRLFLPRRALVNIFAHNMWNLLLELLFLEAD